jgi:hypothetical protein
MPHSLTWWVGTERSPGVARRAGHGDRPLEAGNRANRQAPDRIYAAQGLFHEVVAGVGAAWRISAWRIGLIVSSAMMLRSSGSVARRLVAPVAYVRESAAGAGSRWGGLGVAG